MSYAVKGLRPLSDLKKPTLLLVSPGPKYDPVAFYQARLNVLNNRYKGVVLTSSPIPLRKQVGGFLLIAKKFHSGKLKEFISFLMACYKLPKVLSDSNIKVDLIVSYDPLKSGLLALFLKKRLGAKFAVEINGIYDDPANYADTPNWVMATIKSGLYKRVEAFVVKRADGIKLLYDGQVDGFFKSCSTRPLTRAFANLVDVKPFFARPADLTKKRVLFVGYPHFLKGVDILIDAFSMLVEEYPDWQLTILGWYPDENIIREALLGTKNITYHKPVPPAEMAEQMSAHSIFILPSRAEAMGRVLIEAMAAGTARIGSRQGGIPTVIEDGIDGLLFEKNSVVDLAGCLRTLMGSEALRKLYGGAAKKRVMAEFTEERYLENIHNFYEEIIVGRN